MHGDQKLKVPKDGFFGRVLGHLAQRSPGPQTQVVIGGFDSPMAFAQLPFASEERNRPHPAGSPTVRAPWDHRDHEGRIPRAQ